MPTPDPNNVLFKIAHPDLYERNPFNVLNLPVDATAKDIRRRKEDIEAAFDAGTEASEFANILPGDETRKTPTRAEVDELFATLEDPEKRIAYALFWFWPDDLLGIDTQSKRTRRANPNGAFGHRAVVAAWDKDARLPPDATVTGWISRHNLAVFSHMMGLVYERELMSIPPTDADTPDYVHDYWRSSISWWNVVAAEPDFWRYVSDLVALLEDPRVDYRFARALRDQFAFAFDQINVELAIEFAKTGREADAKRQVEYMKLSQPDSDDVEGTFDDAFAGLLRQTEAIVNAARDEVQENPKNGLKKANEILWLTAEPIRVSRIIFEKGTPIRNSIVTTVFSGVRSCLIAYGNATEDWNNCIFLTNKLKRLAETNEQQSLVQKDSDICRENFKSSICCICGEPVKKHHLYTASNKEILACASAYKDSLTIHMYGEVKKGAEVGKVSYKVRTIVIPVCWSCAITHVPNLMCKSDTGHYSIPEGGYESLSGTLEQLLRTEQSNTGNKQSWEDPYKNSEAYKAILKFSDVAQLLRKGWKVGKEVSQQEICSLWGIPEPKGSVGVSSLMDPFQKARIYQSVDLRHHRSSSGCMIPFAFFVVLSFFLVRGVATTMSMI